MPCRCSRRRRRRARSWQLPDLTAEIAETAEKDWTTDPTEQHASAPMPELRSTHRLFLFLLGDLRVLGGKSFRVDSKIRMAAIIQTENVTKVYRVGKVDVPALRGVSL